MASIVEKFNRGSKMTTQVFHLFSSTVVVTQNNNCNIMQHWQLDCGSQSTVNIILWYSCGYSFKLCVSSTLCHISKRIASKCEEMVHLGKPRIQERKLITDICLSQQTLVEGPRKTALLKQRSTDRYALANLLFFAWPQVSLFSISPVTLYEATEHTWHLRPPGRVYIQKVDKSCYLRPSLVGCYIGKKMCRGFN